MVWCSINVRCHPVLLVLVMAPFFPDLHCQSIVSSCREMSCLCVSGSVTWPGCHLLLFSSLWWTSNDCSLRKEKKKGTGTGKPNRCGVILGLLCKRPSTGWNLNSVHFQLHFLSFCVFSLEILLCCLLSFHTEPCTETSAGLTGWRITYYLLQVWLHVSSSIFQMSK